MKDQNQKLLVEAIVKLIAIGLLVWLGYTIGYSNGWQKGWHEAIELDKKLDCQYEWGAKPNTEVPVKCLKYLQ
mgnify:CR=1 FL=1